MSNTHYGRAENALTALEQILGDVKSQGFLETFRCSADGNHQEFLAAVALVNACRSYIAMFEAIPLNDLIAYIDLIRAAEEPDCDEVFRSLYPWS